MADPPRGAPAPLTEADELRHEPPPDDPEWLETWWFDVWRPDGSLALTCRLAHVPSRRRAGYWCQLVREGEPLLHLADADAPLARTGLTVRAEGLWADHVCEAPFEQWTVANEAYAVRLDDPEEAVGRAYGVSTPLAVDLEWYATGPATATAAGYVQHGEVLGVVELREGAVPLACPAARGHEWGNRVPTDADLPSWPLPAGLRAPIVLPDGSILEQVATPSGWFRHHGETVLP